MDSLKAAMAQMIVSPTVKSNGKVSKNNEQFDSEQVHKSNNVRITNTQSYGLGESAEIPLTKIQDYLRTNLKFRMVCFTNMAHTVGRGFYHTADTTQLQGRKALELIDFFTDEWDFDTLNQKMSLNVWASGNTFLNKISNDPEKEPSAVHGIYKLPLSAFQNIKRADDGTPLWYVYSWGNLRNEEIPAHKIIHWPWLPLDEEAFGEGIGQAIARRGLGYETEAGNTIRRRTWFEQQERLQDSADKHIIAGLPRYAAFLDPEKGGDDEIVDDLTTALNKLDPLQHVVVNAQGKIEQIALESGTKFDSFIRMQNDEVITGMMSPLIRMWSSLDFTYASAESALEAMFPLFDMYNRAHKSFIEKNIYRPVQEQEGINWYKAGLELNWGKQTETTIEDLQRLVQLLSNPLFDNKFSPEELLDSIAEASGISLKKAVVDEQKEVVNKYRDLDKAALKGKSMTIRYNPKKISKATKLAIKKLTNSRK